MLFELERLTQSFPESMRADVRRVLSRSSVDPMHPPGSTFSVRVCGEQITIPGRVYFRNTMMPSSEDFSVGERTIFSLLCTRHHDGFVREKFLRLTIALPEPWAAPFIMKLAGEYVIEILAVIENSLPCLDPKIYAAFLADNPSFYATTRSRLVSYWNCYYRGTYPNFDDYVGSRIIHFFDAVASGSLP